MKILILGDEERAPFHPLGQMARGIYSALQADADLTFTTAYKELTVKDLREYDMVLSYIDSYQTMEGYDNTLADYILQGGKFLAVHNGIITEENSRLSSVLGGNFINHPPRCELNYYLRGEKLFTIEEEAYMVSQTDGKNQIFLEFELKGKKYPAGWYRRSGKGTAAYLQPGHDERTGDAACYRQLLKRTVRELLSL